MRPLVLVLFMLSFLADTSGRGNTVSFPYIQAQTGSTASIQSPSEGDFVQGNVVIRGTAAGDGFQSYEIDFSSPTDPSSTWFLIQEETEPVIEGTLTVWNTTMISDGDYTIRLLVTHANNTTDEAFTQVHVRNYLPTGMDTPTPALSSTMDVVNFPYSTLPTNLDIRSITSTPLPINPAEVTETQVLSSMGKGAGIALGAFVILAIYLGLHALINKRN